MLQTDLPIIFFPLIINYETINYLLCNAINTIYITEIIKLNGLLR